MNIHERHLLDIIGLLSRDEQGCEQLRDARALPEVLGCLWDEDTDVVVRTGRVAATLAKHPAGLSVLFSSHALQKLTAALEHPQLHVRSLSPPSPISPLSPCPNAKMRVDA